MASWSSATQGLGVFLPTCMNWNLPQGQSRRRWMASMARMAAGTSLAARHLVASTGHRLTGQRCRRKPTTRHSLLDARSDRHRSGLPIPLPMGRRLCLQNAHDGRRIHFLFCQHPTCIPFSHRYLPDGLLPGAWRTSHGSWGPLKGKAQPTPNPGSKRLQDCHWAPCSKLIIPSDWL